ncbi:MAG: hypothetical protein EU544_03715 [Promethearchaeota archaeon]|nr:MAG: hypothetical protein EU544_03715 [Candidatus Lokiarchaeota archaeon]
MLETYTFSPYLMLYIGAIIQSLMLASWVIAPQNFKTENPKLALIYEFFMKLGFVTTFLFGIVFLDTAIFWLANQWIYADWRFQLPTVILLLILGFQYVFGSFFVNPKLSDLLYGIGAIVAILIYLHFIVPLGRLRTTVVQFVGVLIVLMVVYLLLWGILSYLDRKSRFSGKNRELWDITEKAQQIFSRKFNLVLYIIILMEVWLKLFGSSLFIW